MALIIMREFEICICFSPRYFLANIIYMLLKFLERHANAVWASALSPHIPVVMKEIYIKFERALT